MDDYKKIPFDDPDLCVPDLDDFDQMKEFFLDCAAEYFRYLSSDDMEKMLAALGKRVDVLATPTDDVFISVSPDAVLRQYPDITIDEAIQIRDNACENIWESGGQSDLDEIVWDQIGAEYKSIKSDSHRGLSDVKDAKAKQAVHVNDDRENDAVALDVQEKYNLTSSYRGGTIWMAIRLTLRERFANTNPRSSARKQKERSTTRSSPLCSEETNCLKWTSRQSGNMGYSVRNIWISVTMSMRA